MLITGYNFRNTLSNVLKSRSKKLSSSKEPSEVPINWIVQEYEDRSGEKQSSHVHVQLAYFLPFGTCVLHKLLSGFCWLLLLVELKTDIPGNRKKEHQILTLKRFLLYLFIYSIHFISWSFVCVMKWNRNWTEKDHRYFRRRIQNVLQFNFLLREIIVLKNFFYFRTFLTHFSWK